MSEEYAAYITIGGRISKDRLEALLEAVRTAGVSVHWGDPLFEPKSADELLTALHEGHLFLCDDQGRYGTFPPLEATCRKLHLSYARWSEGSSQFDAILVDWRPGMHKPLVRVSSNDGVSTYIPSKHVKRALRHLEAGRVRKAKALLRSLCPEIARLPLFKIV